MNKQGLFYADLSDRCEISFSQLVDRVRTQKTIANICLSNSNIDIFCSIVASLVADRPIVLLDSDISQSEKQDLLAGIQTEEYQTQAFVESLTESNLQEKISSPKTNWSLTLFTSGTTGLPKKVIHSFETLTRSVRRTTQASTAVWGFAYNPTHMAGLQVFFQALFNHNPMIRLFGLSKEQILVSIERYGISHLSATPTFYRLLLPLEGRYPSVVRVTSGGEKFDPVTLDKLASAFPNAKITNVYASTEAGSLLAAQGNVFTIKPEWADYFAIVDNELLIHKTMLGSSDSIVLRGDWYATNDLVEVVSQNPTRFKFVSRKNEMINVGGYKVNPSEVEEVLRSHEHVRDAVVYAKENRLLGNVVCCDVVAGEVKPSESELRLFLSASLQEFKIPRIITFVDQVQTTRTGKLTRK